MLYWTVFCCNGQHCVVLDCIVMDSTVFIALYCVPWDCIVLYWTVLCCLGLYCTELYCTG